MALIHVDFFSEVLGMSSQMEVILPQETEGQIGIGHVEKQSKYPVLYLLHGMTDNQTIWTRNTSIERYAAEHGIAVVMPNAHLGWYTDMKYGFKYFTFISEELPELCERFFPCISGETKDRFVAGNSMGGYGAFKLGLTCPEKYAGIASLSGGFGLDICDRLSNDNFYPTLGEDIFGNPEEFRGSEHDLFALAEKRIEEKVQMPKFYMWCGIDDFLLEQNRQMRNKLQELNYDYTYTESEGDHSWKYWDIWIQDILKWIDAIRNGGGATWHSCK